MGLNNLVRSRGFRNFMAKLYGWGAAVVILGALFKINHYPYADYMLIVGLGTESLIFFFSAFEPPHVEPDWSLVYPELAGMYHGMDLAEQKRIGVTEKLDDLLAEAKIGPELIESLGMGLRNLSDQTSKLKDVSNATIATNEFVENVKNASSSAGELSQAYKKTSESLNQDSGASIEYINNIKQASIGAANLSNAYSQASESIKNDLSVTHEFAGSIKAATQSANNLVENYTKSAEILSKSVEILDFSAAEGSSYNEQLKRISDNLSALNAVYELQLQGTNQQVESSAKLQQTMNQFLENINESADKMGIYKEQIDVLTEKVAALNKVYGNMLSAMSFNPNS
jgi:gliding motility-associated protein GldL